MSLTFKQKIFSFSKSRYFFLSLIYFYSELKFGQADKYFLCLLSWATNLKEKRRIYFYIYLSKLFSDHENQSNHLLMCSTENIRTN